MNTWFALGLAFALGYLIGYLRSRLKTFITLLLLHREVRELALQVERVKNPLS